MRMIEKIGLFFLGNILLTILIGIYGYLTPGDLNTSVADVLQNILIIALIVELYDRTKK